MNVATQPRTMTITLASMVQEDDDDHAHHTAIDGAPRVSDADPQRDPARISTVAEDRLVQARESFRHVVARRTRLLNICIDGEFSDVDSFECSHPSVSSPRGVDDPSAYSRRTTHKAIALSAVDEGEAADKMGVRASERRHVGADDSLCLGVPTKRDVGVQYQLPAEEVSFERIFDRPHMLCVNKRTRSEPRPRRRPYSEQGKRRADMEPCGMDELGGARWKTGAHPSFSPKIPLPYLSRLKRPATSPHQSRHRELSPPAGASPAGLTSVVGTGIAVPLYLFDGHIEGGHMGGTQTFGRQHPFAGDQRIHATRRNRRVTDAISLDRKTSKSFNGTARTTNICSVRGARWKKAETNGYDDAGRKCDRYQKVCGDHGRNRSNFLNFFYM
eukprot:GEMP01056876.1.p1 GENE.GEMP01056876.1~~GEMP01056876.1.p1  ORF type:complete len:387 (+),score=82.50 GEMP01056876.1:124-1284(+)